MKYLYLPVLLLLIIASSCDNQDKSGRPAKEGMTAVLPPVKDFDTTIDGKKVSLYYLKNNRGVEAAVTNYGARMVGLWVSGKNGQPVDVVAGLRNIHDYITAEERFFGAIVGRFGNRIAKGQFTLDGKKYQLDINNPPNTLHGGRTGFHSRVWDIEQPDSSSVRLKYVSPDGEEGYPGELTVMLLYRLTDDNELWMSYEIKAAKKTIANITNHNYWNLNGEGSGTINDHTMQVMADRYTPVDSTLIPTGIEPVTGTPFDFRYAKTIREDLDTNITQLKYGEGYDHNFVLNKGITPGPELVTTIIGDRSGIKMEILTTEPGLQFYGGNFMKSRHILKNGSRDDFRTAFCLETQHFPDSPNQPTFPGTVLEQGAVYTSTTIHRFSIAQ